MISQYFTAAILLAAGLAPHAQNWQRMDGCAWIDNRWNDGDSFHVSAAGQEIVARLYFVDTPEAETAHPVELSMIRSTPCVRRRAGRRMVST